MSIIKPGALVFDIGAHIGTISEQLCNAGAGVIIAVEPTWQSFEQLRQKEYVTAIHAACWNVPKIIGVKYAINESGWSSVQPDKWQKAYPDAQWDITQYVPAVTLGQLISMFGIPHLIKIDTEGSEFQIIQSLTHKSRYLIFEFHHMFINDAVKCLRLLQRWGYTRAHYVRDNIDLETEPTTSIEEFIPRWLADAPEWGNITCA